MVYLFVFVIIVIEVTCLVTQCKPSQTRDHSESLWGNPFYNFTFKYIYLHFIEIPQPLRYLQFLWYLTAYNTPA